MTSPTLCAPLPTVAVIGVGLIGGSLGLALRRTGAAERVIGVDPDSLGLEAALELGAIDEAAGLDEAVAVATLVVVATPVALIGETLRKVAATARAGTVVTDTGSTKVSVHRAATAAGFSKGVVFVGGHPLAGSEVSGVRGADAYLFENAFYIITAPVGSPAWAVARIEELARRAGAVPHQMTPEEHDRLVAAVSHLPHAAAAALVKAAVRVAGEDAAFLRFAAGGFRDTTRVAGSDPELWRQILLDNAPEVRRALAALKDELAVIDEALAKGDGEALRRWLVTAQETRRTVPANRKGLLAPVYELVVAVEDRPGAIAGVARALADGAVNLREIEILHLREGEGGSLLVGVDSEEALELSLRLLADAGFVARARR